jgi:hypothetical protein
MAFWPSFYGLYNFDTKADLRQRNLGYEFLTLFTVFNQDQNAVMIGSAEFKQIARRLFLRVLRFAKYSNGRDLMFDAAMVLTYTRTVGHNSEWGIFLSKFHLIRVQAVFSERVRFQNKRR